jgi:hypothetical protein
MLQLLSHMKHDEVELERLRIWDFYLAFPRETQKIVFPQSLSELKKIFKQKEDNPYEDVLDTKKIIERMKSYQLAALKCLASYDFIDIEALSKNVVKKTSKELPAELKIELNNLTTEKANIIKLVLGFWDLPLHGVHGLKARTGLIEFKYDSK